MKTLAEMQARSQAVADRMKAIQSEAGELLTAEQQIEFDELDKESIDLNARIKMALKAEEAQNRATASAEMPIPRQTAPTQIQTDLLDKIPATVKRWGKLRCFKDDDRMAGDKKAYRFGQFLRATMGSDSARYWCQNQGMEIRGAMGEETNSKGGYLVPGEFSSDIIRLVEERGVFRRNARVIPMTQDTLDIPRYSSGSTAYFVGEATAITASDMTLDLVTLVAKKLGAIIPVSSELSDDAVISVADMIAEDIAYKFADKEDECGFNGTGTGSTHGSIVGVRQALIEAALSGTATTAISAGTNTGSLVRADAAGYGGIAIEELTTMIGALPSYAERDAKWYCSKVVYAKLLDLLADAGGNTIQTLEQGGGARIFGYPVQITDVMPKTTAVNQVCLLLGSLRLAATMGDRRMLSMAMSNAAYVGSTSMFETDQVAIRGIERFDINVHDVGDTSNAGPIVGLLTHTA